MEGLGRGRSLDVLERRKCDFFSDFSVNQFHIYTHVRIDFSPSMLRGILKNSFATLSNMTITRILKILEMFAEDSNETKCRNKKKTLW